MPPPEHVCWQILYCLLGTTCFILTES